MSKQVLGDGLIEGARRIHEDRVTIRRAIHAHPEFGFEEHETAALIAARMTAPGAAVLAAAAVRLLEMKA